MEMTLSFVTISRKPQPETGKQTNHCLLYQKSFTKGSAFFAWFFSAQNSASSPDCQERHLNGFLNSTHVQETYSLLYYILIVPSCAWFYLASLTRDTENIILYFKRSVQWKGLASWTAPDAYTALLIWKLQQIARKPIYIAIKSSSNFHYQSIDIFAIFELRSHAVMWKKSALYRKHGDNKWGHGLFIFLHDWIPWHLTFKEKNSSTTFSVA